MLVEAAPQTDSRMTHREPESGTYLGSYMPFVGVRYYLILDEEDLARGRNRIGPVGWRPLPISGAPTPRPIFEDLAAA
jgi:hypothetical protein